MRPSFRCIAVALIGCSTAGSALAQQYQTVPSGGYQGADGATAQPAAPAAPAALTPQPMSAASAQGLPQVSPQAAPQAPPASLPPLPSNVDRFTDSYLGVNPQEIRELHRAVDDRQRAAAEPVRPAKPVTGSVSVSLAPGSTPPVVRPYLGMTSSIVVVDSTGAPWPVENFRVGDSVRFPVNRLDGPQGSTFAIDATSMYGQSNLVLKLAGSATPVVINLLAGQREADARVEVRVQGRGPNATTTTVGLTPGTDSRLLPVLNGLSPEGGKAVASEGLEGVRVWLMPNGRMVVRSPIKIVSPASPSFISSADGTHVYEFMPTSQLLGMSDGQFVAIRIAGW